MVGLAIAVRREHGDYLGNVLIGVHSVAVAVSMAVTPRVKVTAEVVKTATTVVV